MDMQYADLRGFIKALEADGELARIREPVSPHLEMTAIADRVLRARGPALLFERARGFDVPVIANLFGSVERVARAMGRRGVGELRPIGEMLASLKEPRPPRSWRDTAELLPMARALWDMKPLRVARPPCQECVVEGTAIDLGAWPVQTCWPGDAGPLVTWGLTVTRPPQLGGTPRTRQNLGIYRQQVIGRRELIVRWLAHRGGALDFRDHARARAGQPFPVAVALGADPATLLGAVTPVPDDLSEYQFAGLLRGARTELADTAVGADGLPLQVPARAELVLEGHCPAAEPGFEGRSEGGVPLRAIDGFLHALEGPFGDHTGYYNEQAWFPVLRIQRLTHRERPIYHSTYTGKPPDEPAVLGEALNEVFVPILRRQFPEITDFHLPPEACSYRLAVVAMRKQYPGHARRVMFGIWSFLRQFMYTKFIVVTDDDVDIRDWRDVVWAITTRVDPVRDAVLVENTPIDYLDFASPVAGLGAKMGLDATAKWPGETTREWGRVIVPDATVAARVQHVVDAVMRGR